MAEQLDMEESQQVIVPPYFYSCSLIDYDSGLAFTKYLDHHSKS